MKSLIHSSFVHSRGMTLVELLVSITLGLLVIAGIGQIYTAAKRSYDIQTSISRLQEVGRYAIDTIGRDIRQAGYWGLTDMRTLIANNVPILGEVPPDGTCPSGNANWGDMLKRRIFGLNDITGPNGSSYDCIKADWARGDVLVVRYADPALAPVPPAANCTSNNLYVRTAPSRPPQFSGSVNPNCTLIDPATTVHRVVANAYYVQNNSQATCNADVIPALAREELGANGWPSKNDLIAGVENLQFQFGVDSDANGAVDRYFNADTVPNWDNVVSVRLWVLVREECPSLAERRSATYIMGDAAYMPTDRYRRQLYTTTVALRN